VEKLIDGRARAPGDQLAQQFAGALAVADEVVVDDEHHVAPAALAQRLELAHHLRRLLGARHAPVHDHDVAELAVERAAARELDRHGDVVAQRDQVPARHRGGAHVRPLRRAVGRLQPAVAQVFDHLGRDALGFAEHGLPDLGKLLMPGSEQRAAREHRFAEARAACRHLVRRSLVHDHPAQEYHLGPFDVGVAQRSHVQVHQAQRPVRRQHGRHGQQPERRERGFSSDEAENVLEAPERVGVWG
jgi:hypothetical protein